MGAGRRSVDLNISATSDVRYLNRAVDGKIVSPFESVPAGETETVVYTSKDAIINFFI